MKKNMGSIDRTTRIIIASIVALLYATHVIGGVFGIILLVVAGIFLLTSIISFCPLYTVLGINTSKEKK